MTPARRRELAEKLFHDIAINGNTLPRLISAFLEIEREVREECERQYNYPEDCARRLLEGFHKGLDGDALLEFARGAAIRAELKGDGE